MVITQLPAVHCSGGAFFWPRHAVHTVRPRLSAMDTRFVAPIAPPPVVDSEVQVSPQINTPSPKRRRHSMKGPDPNQTPPAPAPPPPVLPTHPETATIWHDVDEVGFEKSDASAQVSCGLQQIHVLVVSQSSSVGEGSKSSL